MPSSENTLEGDQEDYQKHEQENGEEAEEKSQGQEEKADDGPPLPVGFWDQRLHKTRKEVAWKWVATSKLRH